MKKPSFDFSNEGIKRFLLYHVEKLILGLGIILFGLFFWLGFGTEKFTKKEPKTLADLSDQAHSAMVKETSWAEVESFRQADDTAGDRIIELEKNRVAANDYPFEYLLGMATKTAELRKDPAIIPVQNLVAHAFTASVLIAKDSGTEPITELKRADLEEVNNDREEDRDRGGGIGAGGSMPGFGAPADPEPKKQRDDGKIRPGVLLPEYQAQEIAGIHPVSMGVSSSTARPYLCNVVAVTGVVPITEQLKQYRKSLANSRGYSPGRDRPIYTYLQIERQREGTDPKTNKPYEWRDITDKVINRQADVYVAQTPEIVDPEYYDEVLTSPIPTMTQIDYRDLAVWPLNGEPLPTDFYETYVKDSMELMPQMTSRSKM